MKQILKNILFSIVVILASYGITNAGDLFPSGATVSSTFYTLGDVYNKLIDNTTTTPSHTLISLATPTSTFYTLTEIYDKIPSLVASNILDTASYMGVTGTIQTRTIASTTAVISTGYYAATNLTIIDTDLSEGNILSGVNIFGVGGTALSNMFNGTGQGIAGGATSTGGVDDYNAGGQPAVGRYLAEWTQCTSDNQYCGTGDIFAQAKDNNTNLVWALPCAGAGCSLNSNIMPRNLYTWDGTNGWDVSNNGKTAQQLCSSLGNSGAWYLPHQKELLMAYIDGSYGNLEFPGTAVNYWSATTRSDGPVSASAWFVKLSNGNTNYSYKDGAQGVRCVRLAP